MTAHQFSELLNWLTSVQPTHAHHGLCIGGDYQFHNLVRKLFPQCIIIGHPPLNDTKTAKGIVCDILRKPKRYLDRNHDIVDECHKFVATPKEYNEVLRSGTWSTIRYALKAWHDGRPISVTVITP
jgi:hypothetical protein